MTDSRALSDHCHCAGTFACCLPALSRPSLIIRPAPPGFLPTTLVDAALGLDARSPPATADGRTPRRNPSLRSAIEKPIHKRPPRRPADACLFQCDYIAAVARLRENSGLRPCMADSEMCVYWSCGVVVITSASHAEEIPLRRAQFS
ncbi:hypothetical protein L596_018562 [Steinernema carpocapsae]|uniref:Uncharacterized protein n=1 Tax=Steinernema carpocapsae TaxID=34508 RepID=A0A4U5N5A0_STECR|nr:hypothetical protein L596_018562 [Steinernema carpocapsae]